MTDPVKPGTPEYDEAMRSRYQQQSEGEAPLTSDGHRASSHYIPEGGRVHIHRESTVTPTTNVPEQFTAQQADPGQVYTLEQERQRIREELAETRGFDPRTGESRFRIEGEPRRGRELRLQYIEDTLPKVKAMQQQAAAWRRDNLPSAAEKLQAEKAHRETIRQRAETLADEHEAREEAAKIVRTRGLGISRG